jgi:hypothetical protein
LSSRAGFARLAPPGALPGFPALPEQFDEFHLVASGAARLPT